MKHKPTAEGRVPTLRANRLADLAPLRSALQEAARLAAVQRAAQRERELAAERLRRQFADHVAAQ